MVGLWVSRRMNSLTRESPLRTVFRRQSISVVASPDSEAHNGRGNTEPVGYRPCSHWKEHSLGGLTLSEALDLACCNAIYCFVRELYETARPRA